MFKFIEQRNFELFHSFLNSCPTISFQEIIKHPFEEYKYEKDFINPIIVKKSEQLPYQEFINIMYCSEHFVYLASQKRIQIFDITKTTQLIAKLDIHNALVLQECDDCLFVGQLEQIQLLEISKNYALIGSYKLGNIISPYSYLRILNHSEKSIDWYDIIIADLSSNSQKIKCNIYKLFNKRTISFSTQDITNNGNIVDCQNKDKIILDYKKNNLYELLVLKNLSETYSFVMYLMQYSLQIIRINKANKETPILLYNLKNDQADIGLACLGNCLDKSGLIKNSICCSYGNVIHLFIYDISNGYLSVDQIGVKQIQEQIIGLECCENDIYSVQLRNGFGLIHSTEFNKCENGLNYFDEGLKLQKFNGQHMLGLTGNTFEFFELLDCKTLLQNQADQQQFRDAMKNAVRIINGDLLLIKTVSSEELIALLQKLAFTECLFLGKNNNLNLESLSQIVRFLIQIKQEHYLFTIINDMTIDLGFDDVFHKTVEYFIKNHQIPYIPDQQLFELCKQYEKQNNIQMIHHLICSLDFKRIQIAILVSCCDQLKMYNEMIYICQQSQDYVTPLVKLFGRDQLNEECVKYIVTIIDGKNFQGQNLTEEAQKQALQSLIQFLFVNENLLKFVLHNVKQAFDIIYLFYTGTAQTCIENSRAEIILKVQVDKNEALIFDFDETKVETQVHKKMYIIIRKLDFPKSQIWIAYLTAKLLMNKFPLSSEIVIETIQILCRNYEFLLKINSNVSVINQFIMRVIMSKQLTIQQLEDLEFSASIVKKFSLLLVYIQTQQQQYKQAFESFKLINNELKELAFPWIQSLIEFRPMILNSQHDDFIIEVVKFLLTINENSTYHLIEKYFYQKHYQILNTFQKEQEYSKYFVNFLSYLFQSSKIYLINDQTKILYLKHLCKTEPKQVLSILKKMNFPLDEALKLTQEYKINQASAYILEISGGMKKALDIYINSFLKKMKKCIMLLMKKQIIESQSYEKLDLKQESIIRLVLEEFKQSKQVNDESNLWMYFVDLYIKEHKLRTFIMPNVPQQIKQLLCQYLSDYLARISDHVSVQNIFEQLNQKYPELPVTIFRQTIYRVKKTFHDDLRTLQEIQLIQSHEKYQIIQQLNEINQSAWICNQICQRCQNQIIDSELAIAFTCSHVFHDYCVLKGLHKIPYCDKCVNEIQYKILQERILKSFQQSQQIKDQNFAQFMSVNKINLQTNQYSQQLQQQKRVNKKSLWKRYEYEQSKQYQLY